MIETISGANAIASHPTWQFTRTIPLSDLEIASPKSESKSEIQDGFVEVGLKLD